MQFVISGSALNTVQTSEPIHASHLPWVRPFFGAFCPHTYHKAHIFANHDFHSPNSTHLVSLTAFNFALFMWRQWCTYKTYFFCSYKLVPSRHCPIRLVAQNFVEKLVHRKLVKADWCERMLSSKLRACFDIRVARAAQMRECLWHHSCVTQMCVTLWHNWVIRHKNFRL